MLDEAIEYMKSLQLQIQVRLICHQTIVDLVLLKPLYIPFHMRTFQLTMTIETN